MKKSLVLLLLLAASFSILSCSYGILNFAAEKGDLSLNYYINGDNGAGVDQIVFELTAPDGSGTVFFYADVNTTSAHTYVSDMIAGTWSLSTVMMTGDVVFQTHESSVEIYTDGTTEVKLQASYNGTSFDIVYEFYQEGDSTTGIDDGTTDFTIDALYLNPELYLNFRTDELTAAAGLHIAGSGLDSSVRNIELTYPDGAEFFIGESDYYSRNIIYTHSSSDTLIEIRRAMQLSADDISGTYVLKMEDYSGNSDREELTAEYVEIESKVPAILGHDSNDSVPDSLMNTFSHSFQWELSDSSMAGTVMVLVVDQYSAGNIYPTLDAEIVQTGTSGEFTLGPAVISDGDYYLIVAAVEESFTTPIADAVAAGLSPDLRPSTFASAVRSIYGSDSGLIAFSFVSFNYGP